MTQRTEGPVSVSSIFSILCVALLGLGALVSSCDSSPSAVHPKSNPGAADAAGGSKTARSRSWPMWGGTPSRNMVNTVDTGIPHDFNVDKEKGPLKYVKWTADLGSQTYGNPVVAGGKILVGTNNRLERNKAIQGDKGVIMCFRESDGEFLWQAVHDKLASGRVNDWPEQGICSTPVIEGDRFYYVSNRAQVVCADMEGFLDGENDGPYTEEKYSSKIDGDFIWVLDMMDELGVFPHNLATSSPVIGGDLVFVLTSNGVDEGHIDIPASDAPSFVAVDKKTGEVVWEDDSPGEDILHGQWSSPAYGDIGGQKQVVFPGGDGWVYAFEPKSGELIWKFDCNPKDSKWVLGGRGTRNSLISTPVIYDSHVYIAVGQDPEHGEGPGHLYSIDAAGKEGDITKSGLKWHLGDDEFHRTVSTVAIHDGLVYAADLSGFLYCLDLKTGKPYWVHDTLAAVWGSPMVVDGKVILGDEDGDVVILKEGKEEVKLAEHNFGNSVYSTPTIVNGVMYLASRRTLFAISK